MVLKDEIAKHRPVQINESSIEASHRAWNAVSLEQQKDFLSAASAFTDTLFQAEPLILECDSNTDIVELSINKDSDAENGDVRDVIITRRQIQWDIGLSMKHNNFAAKHSRLSAKIDFGMKWYGVPCDKSYWNSITPIFNVLQDLKEQQLPWNKMNGKGCKVYIP